jgi:peptidoglycan/LPS O-acetylase OafA/YrhL
LAIGCFVALLSPSTLRLRDYLIKTAIITVVIMSVIVFGFNPWAWTIVSAQLMPAAVGASLLCALLTHGFRSKPVLAPQPSAAGAS